MYEGEPKTCYGGLALDDRRFLVATYVTSLTGPDEPPYMTGQFTLDTDSGWADPVWYEDDLITGYAMADGPLALDREGRIFDASTGTLLDHPDRQVTTHFGAIAARGAGVFLAGDNGRFWMGLPGSMLPVSNPFYRPLPPVGAPLEAQIAWGQAMQQVFAVLFSAPDDVVVAGARGFLARDRGMGFEPIALPLGAHVTGLIAGPDGAIYLCGHTPSSFIARLAPDDTVTLLYRDVAGPAIRAPQFHDGLLYVAAPGVDGGVFFLEGGKLRPAPFSDSVSLGPAWHLDRRGSALWAVFEGAIVKTERGSSTTWDFPDTE